MFNKRGGKMTVAWLLANDLKQISDCTGGRKRRSGETVIYCKNIYDAADGADVFALMTEW